MPLARLYDPEKNAVISTAHDGFLDRVSKRSDIREYLPLLYVEARTRPGVRVLELGTRQGNSTLAFLAGASEAGGHVWSVDVSPAVLADRKGMGPWQGIAGWTFICGDDLDPDIQAKVPAEVDVLFVDTSHKYGHTLAELRAYMPRVAGGGVALFHDTNLAGWGNEPSPMPGEPEVAQALNAYCEDTGLYWENIPGDYGLGVIRL